MGRRVFSQVEAVEIVRLLREKANADRDRQKTLRGQLRRRYDFYISDFTDRGEGFTAVDFDELAARGTIEILSDPARSPGAPPKGARNAPATEAEGRTKYVLPDVLEPGLRVIFCGTAVGRTSARMGAYYGGPGNRFWSVLERIGLTPRTLSPNEFREVSAYGIGLTDLAKKSSGSDADISASAFDINAAREKIERLAPQAFAFNGKRAAEAFLGRSVEYGRQSDSVGETAIFVLPSASAAARRYWDESHWVELAEFLTADTGTGR